jgi:hypothetical protein
VYCQAGEKESFSLMILNEQHQGVPAATVNMLQKGKSVSSAVAGAQGRVVFEHLARGAYVFLISSMGYQPKKAHVYALSFTYRFGKANKVSGSRHEATEEEERVNAVP